MISEYCRKCSGEGRIRVKKDIKVKVPPGVSKGSILRVAGEGDAGPRGMQIATVLGCTLWPQKGKDIRKLYKSVFLK